MRYTKRELRMIDMFALMWFGAGLFFIVMGVIGFVLEPKVVYTYHRKGYKPKAITVSESAPLSKGKGVGAGDMEGFYTKELMNLKALSNTVLGVVFLALGIALNVAFKRVLRNKGCDLIDGADEGATEQPGTEPAGAQDGESAGAPSPPVT